MESPQGSPEPAAIPIDISLNTQYAFSAVDLCAIFIEFDCILIRLSRFAFDPGSVDPTVETSPSLPVLKIAYPFASNTHYRVNSCT